jgi:hypothetical protein
MNVELGRLGRFQTIRQSPNRPTLQSANVSILKISYIFEEFRLEGITGENLVTWFSGHRPTRACFQHFHATTLQRLLRPSRPG